MNHPRDSAEALKHSGVPVRLDGSEPFSVQGVDIANKEAHMVRKQSVVISVAVISCAAVIPSSVAGQDDRQRSPTGLVREVRQGTADFRDLTFALAAGYSSTGSCVSGPQEGAMGIHFANGALIDNTALDPQAPELLIYEQRGDRLRLVGVEFLVIAEAWHAVNPAPPVLLGQHFQLVGAPNRYGLPPFYELHVWAWRNNPHGMFVDWNPAVSCEEYTGDEALATAPGHAEH